VEGRLASGDGYCGLAKSGGMKSGMQGTPTTIQEKFSSPEDSRFLALIIALAPFVFQAARSLRDLGLLRLLKEYPGSDLVGLRQKSGLTEYAVSVLMDAGESCAIIQAKDGKFFLTQTGVLLEGDPLTQVNMNFAGDVCYQGLGALSESLTSGQPKGLAAFGNWPTIYAGLTQLPEKALKSWLAFDHYFSDDAFPRALPLIFRGAPKRILDVGGNTGKFAMACAHFDSSVRLTLLDHPAQLEIATENFRARGLNDRINCIPTNILDHTVAFPKDYDVIWMSQFLDCFGKDDIEGILQRARAALAPGGCLYILETFIDRQRYDAARFCLDMTSLYFTAMANGQSRMYRATDFYQLLERAGFAVAEESNVKMSHTLLKCVALG
jgi:ubiquinone/menaquinone biosynthesis C-methylase UbiE